MADEEDQINVHIGMIRPPQLEMFLPELMEQRPFRFEDREDILNSNSNTPDNQNYSDLSDEFGTMNKQVEFQPDAVSGRNECIADQAKKLCIFDLALKLCHSDHYDIGGIYLKGSDQKKSQLWFYCTTSVCPSNIYILNIFVCNRNIGSFAIGISDSNVIVKKKIAGHDEPLTYLSLPNKLSWKTYKSCEVDESHHIKSYCFTKEHIKLLSNKTFCIPVEVNINPTCVLDRETIMRIKRNHDLLSLFKRGEKTDFKLQSTSGKKYDIHKLLLAAHSSVLRNVMKNSKSDSLVVNLTDDAMEQFLEYIYTGFVKNILVHNCSQLIEMAEKFKLDNLLKEIELALSQQVSITNAVDIAVLSEKFKLEKIQENVFEFIKYNPEVLETDGWMNLGDVSLTKKLFKQVYFVRDST